MARRRSVRQRNTLVKKHLHLVEVIAFSMKKRLPSRIDLETLVSAGNFGLIEAAESFDVSRDVQFDTHASPRIRGAIYDELRRDDVIPRHWRSIVRTTEEWKKAFTREHQRFPNRSEVQGWVRERFGESMFQKVLPLLETPDEFVLSFTASKKEHYWLEDVCSLLQIPSEDRSFASMLFDEAMHRATDRERYVILRRLFHKNSWKEIGATLGVTESRVCHIYRAFVERMRVRFSAPELVCKARPGVGVHFVELPTNS